jgi:hypothetical protein
MSRHRRIADKVLSAPVGVTAACVMLAIFFGCMSLEIGNRTVQAPPCEEGVLCQQGEIHVAANSSQFVHYPLPYPRKPNIEIDSTFDDCEIAEERVDGFLLRNPNCLSRTVKWKARGMKCEPPPVAPGVSPPPVTATTPTLPAPTPERDT